MHPQLAKIFDIADQDEILVENERGTFSARAWLSEDLDPRVLWCPEGADPYQPHIDCNSPQSLFREPITDCHKEAFAMVRIGKKIRDFEKNRQRLNAFLKELDSAR